MLSGTLQTTEIATELSAALFSTSVSRQRMESQALSLLSEIRDHLRNERVSSAFYSIIRELPGLLPSVGKCGSCVIQGCR